MNNRLADGVALALAILAAVATATISLRVFERIPHVEDEFANLWQAEVMAHGRLDLPSPPEPKGFIVPFVVDYEGRRFGKYTPGWPAALSLGARAGAPWLVNTILAGMGVWLTYRLGTKIAGRGVGLLAALLTGVSPMFLMLSGSLMSHALSMFLVVAFSLAWLDLFPRRSRISETPSTPPWLMTLVGGLALGLLTLTRPLTAVGVGLPFAIHGGFLLVRGDGGTRRRVLAIGGLALLVGAILFLWQAALTGDPLKNPYTLWWSYDRIGFGPGRGLTESGHTLRLAQINTRFSLRAGKHDLFGWPYFSWLFLPFGFVALWRNRDAWLLSSTAPTLVIVYAAYWIGAWLFGPRYYYESLPNLAIISAAGVSWLAGWMSQAPRWRRLRTLVVAFLFMILLGLNLFFYVPIRVGGMHGLYGISRERMRTLLEADLQNALVFVHADHWTQYGTLLTLSPPFAERDLLLVWTNNPRKIETLSGVFSGRAFYHYYPDEPGKIYQELRDDE